MISGETPSHELFQTLLQHSTDLVSVLDADGVLRYASPSYVLTLGYNPTDLIGTSAFSRIHPEDLEQVRAAFAATRRSPGTPIKLEFRYRHADGSWRTLQTTATNELENPVVRGIIINAHDITDRVQAYDLLEQRVEERTRELATLLNVSRNVASTLDRDSVPNLILDELKTVMDYSGAGIGVLAESGLQIIGYRGPAQSPELSLTYQPGSWPAWEVLRRHEAVLIDDVRGGSAAAVAYRGTVGDSLETMHGHVRCFLAVPMVLRDEVIGALSLVHAQPGYYTEQHVTLARAVADHAAVAIENAELYERAQDRAVLEERQRLARELHDSVSQALYGIALGTQTARSVLRRDLDRTEEALNYVLAQAEAGLAEMRALIFDLRPEALERDGIVTALRRQAAAVSARQTIAVDTLLGNEPDLPFPIKEALYRIAQEALHNIIKHAQARNVIIGLHQAEQRIVLEVQDDGLGFEPDMCFPGHVGLKTMRERAVRAGGSLIVESSRGGGTRIRAVIPGDVEAVA